MNTLRNAIVANGSAAPAKAMRSGRDGDGFARFGCVPQPRVRARLQACDLQVALRKGTSDRVPHYAARGSRLSGETWRGF